MIWKKPIQTKFELHYGRRYSDNGWITSRKRGIQITAELHHGREVFR